ncbi:UNVERIFIED_CONTAM: Calcium-transporting ATPase 10, plasma membrane-type [Sesamum radiatum]|uniref:Calcium-transporting ATPase 10, plasma membrane-type n=1 Tax=Sesamum radiatum TaxID=300843 RepID=A0AAW2KQE6_SESRA
MSDEFKTSPYRRYRADVEAGNSSRNYDEDEDEGSGPFDIVRTKSAPVDRLRRWRQAALVLNASRRFRYTLDLKKEEEKKQLIAKIRMHAQVIRAAVLFQAAGQGVKAPGPTKLPPSSPTRFGDFGISAEELVSMSREHDLSLLQQNGGVKGVAEKLKINLEKGAPGDEADLIERKKAFGSNTYPRKKGRSFWRFVWEACRDTTLIILMVAAAASLALGIKTEGIKEGWYDGGSIALAVLIVIIFTAVSDYKQSLQFQNLNEEKQNIQMEVPADGLVISGHSLAIDESSMTGESKIVTSVGINTEWGLLMASISEDNGEETPLQVRLNGVATFIGIVGLAVAVAVLIILVARLAYSMRKMMADKALVRRLSACETMGSATTICSDKTGTLTLNQMTVVEAYACGRKIDPPDNKSLLPPRVISLIVEGVAQNTTGSVFVPEGGGALEVSGSPTEKAILQWALNDPCRPGVRDAVQLCINAGVKLLWVNLIMDTLGALALATEPPTDHLMRRPPVGRSWPLAAVGKLIPVPDRPFGEYFTKKRNQQKNPSGKGHNPPPEVSAE